MAEGLLATDAQDRIVYANARCSELLGLPGRKILGRDLSDLIEPADVPLHKAHVALQRRGRTDRVELALRGPSERSVPAVLAVRPVYDAQGRVEGRSIALSPTVHPVFDEPDEESDPRLHEVFALSPSVLYARTPDHTLTWVSPQARAFLGGPPEHALTTWRDLVTGHPANRAGLELARKAAETGHRQPPYDLEIRRPDGSLRWIEVNETPVVQHGRTTEIVGALTDVTERRRAEELLQIELDLGIALGTARTLHDAARHALDAALDTDGVDAGGLYRVDTETGDLVLQCHRGFSDAFVAALERIPADAPRGTLIRRATNRGIDVVDPETLREGLVTTMAFPIRQEGRLLASLTVASRRLDALPAATVRALKTIACQLGPLVARFDLEASLERSTSTLRSLAISAPAGIGLVRDRTFQWVNGYMTHRTGYPARDLLGRSTRVLYADGAEFDRVGRELREQIERDGMGTVETRWKRRDGTQIDVLLAAAALDGVDLASGMVFTAWDVTERNAVEEERRRLEHQVQQTQKLESLGLLAGGVAHDFNNLLHAIMGHASMAGQCLLEPGPAATHLDAIERAASRAGELCRQMLAYSGRGSFVVERMHLGEILTDLASMLDVTLSKNTELCVDVVGDRLPIEADASQMRQVILNLITNAAEAIGDEAGLVRVTVAPVRYDRERLNAEFWQAGLEPGTYVTLKVEDTGCGMDAATRERIFEPFFTTKFTGRGLGLAAIQGIVRGHGGAIRVTSEVGRGTNVTVLLPVASGKAKPRPVVMDRAPTSEACGTVLLADDERPVRELQALMLESAGFEVVAVEDGLRAVEVFRERPEEFRCVLLDLTMPAMDGEQAFAALREIRPDVPVILCSGFSAQELDHRFNGDRPAGFLEKPFRADALLTLIHQVAPA